jgi:hypothetical protein
MKFRLTIDVDTAQELAELAAKLGAQVINAQVDAIPEKIEAAPEVKPAAKKKAAPAVKAEVVETQAAPILAGPFLNGAPAVTQPAVQQAAPLAAAPVAEIAIDREKYNTVSVQVLNDLKAALVAHGKTDADAMNVVLETFAEVGVPAGNRITTMPDALMINFLPAFQKKALGIINAVPSLV